LLGGGGLCFLAPYAAFGALQQLLQPVSANVAPHGQAKSEKEKNSEHYCAKSNKTATR
jgi:hypothetical protein